jgi:hypothetical protein
MKEIAGLSLHGRSMGRSHQETIMRPTVESIPRGVLRELLARGDAAPLGASVRGFMESRFRAGFSDVRVHTGRLASTWCRRLGAGAFTLGRDIVFGEGQYAPDTASGSRLLAHELVHVLQQRSRVSGAESPSVPVGSALDACESEADRLAGEALGTGLRSAVTTDTAGAIRRQVEFDTSGDWASLDTNHEGARPEVTMGAAATDAEPEFRAIIHQTKGDPLNCLPQTGCTPYDRRAIQIDGSVLVKADSREEISSSWELHFRQYCASGQVAFYAGRTRGSGAMSIRLKFPAAFGSYVPDFDPGRSDDYVEYMTSPAAPPPIEGPDGGGPGLYYLQLRMGDHPRGDVRMNVKNPRTEEVNYLYDLFWSFNAITVLIAVNKRTREVYPLAYQRWGVALLYASFRWAANPGSRYLLPTRSKFSTSPFMHDLYGRGSYPDDIVAKMSKNPPGSKAGKSYDELIRTANLALREPTVDTPGVDATREPDRNAPQDLFR